MYLKQLYEHLSGWLQHLNVWQNVSKRCNSICKIQMYLWQLQVHLLGTHSCHCSWSIHKNIRKKQPTTLVQIAHFLKIKTHTHTHTQNTHAQQTVRCFIQKKKWAEKGKKPFWGQFNKGYLTSTWATFCCCCFYCCCAARFGFLFVAAAGK